MDAIKTFIGKHRPWLVGAGFLMVLYIYQARPFDKQAEAATGEGAKSLKDTIVGTWKVGMSETTSGGAAPRKVGTKAGTGTYVIRADNRYTYKGRATSYDNSWGLGKGNFSHPGNDAVYRKGKPLGDVQMISFHNNDGTNKCHVASFTANQIVCEGYGAGSGVGAGNGERWTLNRSGGAR